MTDLPLPFPHCLVALALLLGPTPATAQDHAALLAAVDGSLADAIAAAALQAKTGTPVHAEIERDGARVVFSIDFAQGDRNLCLVLDGKTKAVLEREDDDDDHSVLVAAARVPLGAAIATAERTAGGRAIEAQLRRRGDRIVHVVTVVAATLRTVQVDAVDGSLVEDPQDPAAAPAGPAFTERFPLEPDELTHRGVNPFFVLEPGHQLVLEGDDDGGHVVLQITVLDETVVVDGVETRVVEERETQDGELVEISRNFFAISKRTASLYYFGEDVDIYENGAVVSHDGAWRSGRAGARFGLLLPGTPLLGGRYYQEIAPGVAMDRAEIVADDEVVACGAGRFEGCLRTVETTPLDAKEHSKKVYARGVGLVVDGPLQLVRHGRAR